MRLLFPTILLCAAAHAAEVAQFRADADGDGIDDATELAGLAAGVPDLDPLAPATEDGTIACGTADYVSPESLWDGSMKAHREADVKPYIKALHLDGNPGHPDNGSGLFSETVPSRLTQPCLHQDYYLRQYLNKRPSFPTGVLEQ